MNLNQLPTTMSGPVIIFSNPRTGSTALTKYLAEKYNYAHFLEPHLNRRLDEEFLEYSKTSDRYVVKLHARRLEWFYPYDFVKRLMLDDSVFRIRLYRKDVLAQTVSMYIAKTRNRWQQLVGKEIDTSRVEIDPIILDLVVNEIHTANLKYNKNIKYNLELCYEDLGYIQNENFTINSRPNNYDEIVAAVKQAREML